MKTNKSFTKRLRVTKRGKIVARPAGHNHFNAKQSGAGRMHRHRDTEFHAVLDNTAKSRYLSQ